MLQLCYSSRMILQGKCYSSAPPGECFPSECIRALFRPPECINSDPLGISFPREKCCSFAFLWPRPKKKKLLWWVPLWQKCHTTTQQNSFKRFYRVSWGQSLLKWLEICKVCSLIMGSAQGMMVFYVGLLVEFQALILGSSSGQGVYPWPWSWN